MGLLDWLRGGQRGGPTDTQEERSSVRQEEQAAEPSLAETAPEVDASAQERHDAEASRHSGI